MVYDQAIRTHPRLGIAATIRRVQIDPSGAFYSMFRLDKLEIHGFKWFYYPAHLAFPAPMTAVVGPNGCGKSNICDAIIWGLGENRPSHIRGEYLDDVICQGSSRRDPLP